MNKIKKGETYKCIKTIDNNDVSYLSGKIYKSEQEWQLTDDDGYSFIIANEHLDHFELYEETNNLSAPKHYDNSRGSLYKFANDNGLNSWEFDLIKRIIRCRKKGNFKEDLEKTKFLIDLYLKEFEGIQK